MAYTKTTWVNDQQPDIDADNLNKMEQGILDAQFPDGGTEGQLLAKTVSGQEWVDAPNSAVWGGITGDIADQTDLQAALSSVGKVDSVNGIEPDAQKNVQVDVEITKQGWDALPSSKYTDDINYYIKDGTNIPQAGVISASGVTYSNTSSGLDATTVQGAIDENASEIATVKNGLTIKIGTFGRLSGTSQSAFETALITRFSTMEDSEILIGLVYANYSGSITSGASAIGIMMRISNGIYKLAIPDVCTAGYYYSGSWHWSNATMASI